MGGIILEETLVFIPLFGLFCDKRNMVGMAKIGVSTTYVWSRHFVFLGLQSRKEKVFFWEIFLHYPSMYMGSVL